MMSLGTIILLVLILLVMFGVISAVEQDWRTGALVIGLTCLGLVFIFGAIIFSFWLENLLTTG